MPTTTGCSGRRRPSPGMSRFPHASQGVGSTKPQSTYGQQAGAVCRSHLYPRLFVRWKKRPLASILGVVMISLWKGGSHA
jgi:hypothetical protein